MLWPSIGKVDECRIEAKLRDKRREAEMIHRTTNTNAKRDEHPTATLAYTQVITRETHDTVFHRKNKAHKHHWNEFEGSYMSYRISAGTTIDNQERIIRQDRRGEIDKYLATLNTFRP